MKQVSTWVGNTLADVHCLKTQVFYHITELLLSHQLLSGFVSSVEDHGYLIDIGVSGTNAFLPRQKAQNYIKTVKSGKK